jgi:hypothetical protein
MSTKRISCLKIHLYTASQTFLLQRKQVQKIDKEVVQQRRRQAQVLLIVLQCSLLYMQLIVTGVSLCPSPGASYYGELLFQMHIQWANSS